MDEKSSLCKMTRLLPSPYPEAVLYQLFSLLDCSGRKVRVSYSCSISYKSLDYDIMKQSLPTPTYFGCMDLSRCM